MQYLFINLTNILKEITKYVLTPTMESIGQSYLLSDVVMCNSGDISIYRDMKFHIVIRYEVLSIVIITISVFDYYTNK